MKTKIKTGVILSIYFLLSNCMNKTENKENLVWDTNTVRSIKLQKNKNYIIELGISAQIFYLNENTDGFNKIFNSLESSFENNKKIKIGIQQNTNQIKEVLFIE